MKHLPEIEVGDICIAGREVHKVYIRKEVPPVRRELGRDPSFLEAPRWPAVASAGAHHAGGHVFAFHLLASEYVEAGY